MRVLFLVSTLVLVAGCASKAEEVAFNTVLYNRCVSQAGADAPKKCGGSPSLYQPTFSDRYSYFQDQYREQQRQQAIAEANDPNREYKQCYAAMMLQPGLPAQRMSNAYLFFSGRVPFSATRPVPSQSTTTNCHPNGIGGFSCTTQ